MEVDDEPDEPPRWIELLTFLQFEEKTATSYTFKAIDGDVKLNKSIRYKISDAKYDEISIHETTGVLSIAPMDRDFKYPSTKIQFDVVAYEEGDEDSQTPATVNVDLLDVNDQKPVINADFSDVIEMNEGSMNFPNRIMLEIEDADLVSNCIWFYHILIMLFCCFSFFYSF